MYYDQTAVTPLDFTVRLNAMKDSIDEEVFEQAGVSSKEMISEIDTAIASAEKINKEVNEINENYLQALKKDDDKTAKKLYEDSRVLN